MTNKNRGTGGDSATLPKPEVAPVHKGVDHTVLQGSSEGAAFMPEHYSTHEAVVVVVEGRVEIQLTESGVTDTVAAGECYVIRPGEKHTLSSRDGFRLFLTMPSKAEIRFEEAES